MDRHVSARFFELIEMPRITLENQLCKCSSVIDPSSLESAFAGHESARQRSKPNNFS